MATSANIRMQVLRLNMLQGLQRLSGSFLIFLFLLSSLEQRGIAQSLKDAYWKQEAEANEKMEKAMKDMEQVKDRYAEAKFSKNELLAPQSYSKCIQRGNAGRYYISNDKRFYLIAGSKDKYLDSGRLDVQSRDNNYISLLVIEKVDKREYLVLYRKGIYGRIERIIAGC